MDRTKINKNTVKGSSVSQPFEFSGDVQVVEKTPDIKLVTQLFGERTM